MHTQARQLAGARGDKPSQQLATPHKREVRDIGQGNMSATRGRVVERLVEDEEDLRAAALDRRVVAREAARRRVVRHVARDLAVRLEHADEGGDLQLADHRDVVPLLLRRHIRDRAAVREERVLALDDAKALSSRGTRPSRRGRA